MTELPAVSAASVREPALLRDMPPLKVGLIVEEDNVPAWVAYLVEAIAAAGHLRLARVIRIDRRRNAAARVIGPNWLLGRYLAWDRRRFAVRPDALAVTSLYPTLKEIPSILLESNSERGAVGFQEDDAKAIKSHKLDVILYLGTRPLEGRIWDAARAGVWVLRFGDRRQRTSTPAYFWELYDGKPTAGIMLRKLSACPEESQVLYRSFSAVHGRSLSLTRNAVYWKGAAIVLRCLTSLQQQGQPAFLEPVAQRHTRTDAHRERGTPGFGRTAGLLAKILARRLSHPDRLVVDHWQILIRRRPPQGQPWDPAASFAGFEPLTAPKGRFWADPFLLEQGGQTWIFFEDCSYRTGRGRISCSEVDENGRVSEPTVAMERDCHLSNPFVFEHRGELYLIPEAEETKRIELYRCERFPDRWVSHSVLVENVSAVDAVIAYKGGKFWLFANMAGYGMSFWDELFLFSADRLEGPWQPYPGNPVVSDVTQARPAGRIMDHDGTLVRAVQDCGGGYGSALSFCLITELSENAYEQRMIRRIEPREIGPYQGVHAYDRSSRFEVIDARRTVLRRTVMA